MNLGWDATISIHAHAATASSSASSSGSSVAASIALSKVVLRREEFTLTSSSLLQSLYDCEPMGAVGGAPKKADAPEPNP